MPGALDGLLVVSVEQAVAAPYCSARLADAGARVIKIERPEGDFARGYDGYVHGLSSYFVWLNRGKQSVTLDFKAKDDLALLHRMIAKADVLIQNLAPGAAERAGFGSAAMRAAHKRLITVDISGYGDHGPYKNRRAYDLLVQAESGLASITGTEHAPGRVGVSATDIGTGMYAHAAVLEALLARQKTGEGRALWRLSDGRQGAGADLDPERSRIRAALPRCAGQAGTGEGSGLRHQQGAQRAARRHQRHRSEELWRATLRRARS